MSSSQRPPPSPPLQERLLGTLIVIVLRAKNLPNRVRIGKQNPYATVTYGLHKKRTETIERGGQQPTWDAEFRFEILKEEFENEQLEAGGAAHVDRKGGVLPMSTKDGGSGVNRLEKPKPTVTVGDGRRILKLACWADDNRDPRLIGEGELNIEDTIRKGKFDDWVKLERKGRYAGEVYLELTWYSNEPKPASLHRPERSDSPTRGSYGGAGARLNDHDDEEESEENDIGERDERDRRSVNHRHSQASLEPSNSSLHLAPDYPDSDLAPLSANHYPDSDLDPLTRSMSSLSVGRPLPQPPVPASHSQYAQVAHSQTYSHLPTPSDGFDYNNRERRTSFHSVAPSQYSYQQQQPRQSFAPSAPMHQQYSSTPQPDYIAQPPPNEFGTYADQEQYPSYHEPQTQQLGEFEQLAHQHYASQVYDQSSVSSQRPLPQPGAPSTQLHHDPYNNSYAPPPSSNPYPPPLPQPPVPPIPPSTSVYWQKQQQQQLHREQYQQPAISSSATYPNLPPSMSYQQLAHSASHTSIHPSPSTPSFAPPPSFSAPPPSHLSQSYSNPPASSFAPPPVFSPPPPPPPPSLQGAYSSHPIPVGPYPPPSNYQNDPNNYGNGRPPLPPPPPAVQQHQPQQQYYHPY
ncbi:uncharacterized protein JCM6883_002503 [Sporobolomyces salmoneus]|uniref:uncharacterized protein n=1 Tax=Sporobolomyces salmoneus TaxID=183962 RepID=UPI00318068F8